MAISVEQHTDTPIIQITVDSRLNYQMVCQARQQIAQLAARSTTPLYCITELSLANVSLTETLETIKLITRNLTCKNSQHYFVGHDHIASFASSVISRVAPGECHVCNSMDEALHDIQEQLVPAHI